MKKVVVIGGGTGSYTVLKGLKKYPVDLSAIVSMFDSGGSTGKLRDELGALPPGDIRRCLIALADDEGENVMRELLQYRFEGGAGNHSLGNLMLAAAEKKYGNIARGIGKLSKILRLKGQVYPVSLDNCQLCARLADGTVIKGESKIDIPTGERASIEEVYLEPEARIYEKAKETILAAHLIVIGPGDLYTSLIPNPLVKGGREAIRESRGKVAYVCNLMTKHGETDGYTASRFLEEIEKYFGKRVDYVVCNKNGVSEKLGNLLAKYEEKKQFLVENNLEGDSRLIVDELFYEEGLEKGLIRHHRDRLAERLVEIVNNI